MTIWGLESVLRRLAISRTKKTSRSLETGYLYESADVCDVEKGEE